MWAYFINFRTETLLLHTMVYLWKPYKMFKLNSTPNVRIETLSIYLNSITHELGLVGFCTNQTRSGSDRVWFKQSLGGAELRDHSSGNAERLHTRPWHFVWPSDKKEKKKKRKKSKCRILFKLQEVNKLSPWQCALVSTAIRDENPLQENLNSLSAGILKNIFKKKKTNGGSYL